MATLEMVQRLREHANVTYDEAREALNACSDDLLEAIIYLEKKGKVAPPSGGGYYDSRESGDTGTSGAHSQWAKTDRQSFGQLVSRFFKWCAGIIHKGNVNMFEVYKDGKLVLTVPVTVLIVLAVFCFWVVIPLLLVGLFFGCKYLFKNADKEHEAINNVIEEASKTADSLKSEIGKMKHGHKNDDGESAK